MPPRRQLKATLSNVENLGTLHKMLLQDIRALEEEAVVSRKPIWQLAHEYQVGRVDADAVLEDLICVRQHLTGASEQEARDWAKDLLQARGSKVLGMHTTCIVQWRFDDASMWRGPPDNIRILRFCRSIVSTCFRQDACIAARSLDMSTKESHGLVLFQLLFGDGSARGVSAMIVWILLVRRAKDLQPDPDFISMVESIWHIPTNFEEHGNGSLQDALIAQAARQNQAALQLPVNTIQWVGMIKDYAGLEIGVATSKASMVKVLEQMVQAYNAHPDVNSYSEEPPAKRARTRRGAKPVEPTGDEGGHDKGLKIGNRRLLAMKNFLSGGTQAGYDLLRMHLVWVSDYKVCVLNDEIMMRPWFWVGSSGPKEHLPSVHDLSQKDVGPMTPDALVPKGASYENLHYDTKLTSRQFELMLGKAIAIFEDDISTLERDDQKVRAKPKEDTCDPWPVQFLCAVCPH
jgi:hypothetical protein